MPESRVDAPLRASITRALNNSDETPLNEWGNPLLAGLRCLENAM
jgi:hypothetical protein